MKTIKKLNLHPGQEIGKVQQQFIMAGSGQLQWTGNCFCTRKGNQHTMKASETFEYIDWVDAGVALLEIIGGCAIIVGTSGTVGDVVGGGFIGSGISQLVGIQKTGTINYAQVYKCIGVNPLTHSALLVTSSVTY